MLNVHKSNISYFSEVFPVYIGFIISSVLGFGKNRNSIVVCCVQLNFKLKKKYPLGQKLRLLPRRSSDRQKVIWIVRIGGFKNTCIPDLGNRRGMSNRGRRRTGAAPEKCPFRGVLLLFQVVLNVPPPSSSLSLTPAHAPPRAILYPKNIKEATFSSPVPAALRPHHYRRPPGAGVRSPHGPHGPRNPRATRAQPALRSACARPARKHLAAHRRVDALGKQKVDARSEPVAWRRDLGAA